MADNKIEEQWLAFRAQTIKPETRPEDVEMFRQVFYAGAIASFEVTRAALLDKSKAADQVNAELGSIERELRRFAAELGRAIATEHPPCKSGEHVPAIVHRTGGPSAESRNVCGRCGRPIVCVAGVWTLDHPALVFD